MIIPETLEEWDLETVEQLTAHGQTESDRHDFKADLPDSLTLTKLACSFANSYGGFIIVGVRERSGHWMVEGVERDNEMAGRFGQR